MVPEEVERNGIEGSRSFPFGVWESLGR